MLELPSKGMKGSSSEMRTESALQKMHAPVVSRLPASAKPGSTALCRELGTLPMPQLRPPQDMMQLQSREAKSLPGTLTTSWTAATIQ